MPRLFWLTRTRRDRRIPFRSPIHSRLHFDYITVDVRSVGGVSPRVGIQVDETEDESVQEKSDAWRGLECCEETRLMLARTISHLNIIRIYVTWSIPVPFTNLVSSSVADMNSRPPATRNYMACIRTCISLDLVNSRKEGDI